MISINIVITLIIGLLAGLIGSNTGTAGGAIMVSGLLLFNVFKSTKVAIGTVLLALLPPLSIGAIGSYWEHSLIDFKVAALLIIANMVGATIGGYIVTNKLTNKTINLFNSVYLMILSVFYFYKYYF